MSVLTRTRPASQTTGRSPVGDGAAFARLYDRYFDAIYWYCRRRLGDATTAEDAASSVFARALAAGPRYDDPALRSWLFAIAHNVLANHYRARHVDQPLETALALRDPGPSPEERAVDDEERERLHRLLALLPADQRRVVELRLAGLNGPEIARALDRSHAAVKMLQLRAYARLRELLADDFGEGVRDG